MDVNEAIKQRRSIRRFTGRQVDRALLAELLEAVRWAPSWGNSQCWEVVVVGDKEQRLRLRDTLSPRNPAIPAMETAPLVLVLAAGLDKSGCYKGRMVTKFSSWHMFDIGLACQNILLTAHNLGLGSVVIGAFDHDRAGEILAMPEGYEVICLLPVGYPDQKPSPPKRREAAEFCHGERFGGSVD